jgi:hypothetical protein
LATFPELFLVSVAAAPDEDCFDADHLGAGGVVVVVVEAFNDLERSAALEYVATHEIAPKRRGVAVSARCGEAERALLEQEIGASDELVERVEMTPGPFDILQGLGRLSDRVDHRGRTVLVL